MRLSALFSFAALIAVVVAAGTTPVEDTEALADSAVLNAIEPHYNPSLNPRDDPANRDFVNLLEKRQSTKSVNQSLTQIVYLSSQGAC